MPKKKLVEVKDEPAVSPEYIDELGRHLMSKFDIRNQHIENVRDRRYLRKPPIIPAKFKSLTNMEPFQFPLILDVLRRATAIVGIDFPRPTVVPLEPGDKEQRRSSLREKWLPQAYRRMFGHNAYDKGIDSLFEAGEAVWHVREHQHAFSNVIRNTGEKAASYNRRVYRHHQQTFPYSALYVDPTTWYPVYDEEGTLTEVLEITQRERLPLMKRYKDRLGDRAPQYADMGESSVKFTQYTSRTETVYLVENEEVYRVQHNYGIVPYFSATAIVNSSLRREDWGMSFVYPLIALQDAISNLITMWMNWGFLNGFPMLKLKPVTGEDAIPDYDEKPSVELVPGGIFVPPTGFEANWWEAPGMGGELRELERILKSYVDEFSLADILRGAGESGQLSGVAAQLMIAVAKSIFGPGVHNVNQVFNDIAAFVQRRIDVGIKDVVPIWSPEEGDKTKKKGEWIELGPDDIEGYYAVEHTLDAIIPAEQMAKSLWLNDGVQRGLVPKRVAIEEGYNQHAPEEWMDEIYIETIYDQPNVNSRIIEEALNPEGSAPVPPPGPPANTPISPGGAGQVVTPGINQPIQPGAPMPARAPGQGRG